MTRIFARGVKFGDFARENHNRRRCEEDRYASISCESRLPFIYHSVLVGGVGCVDDRLPMCRTDRVAITDRICCSNTHNYTIPHVYALRTSIADPNTQPDADTHTIPNVHTRSHGHTCSDPAADVYACPYGDTDCGCRPLDLGNSVGSE